MSLKGRPECLLSRINSFWSKHQVWLESHYPGINLNRLKQELESYLIGFKISPKHFWNLNYGLWEQKQTDAFFEGLLDGRPLQYISGRAYFFESDFLVDEKVLIPRSESERLVELSLSYFSKNKKVRPVIADIGTGSGCLLLSIARGLNQPMEGVGIDISAEALKIAKLNYHRLQYTIHSDSQITFEQNDRLKESDRKYDLIVSNPPYIKKEGDLSQVHHQVKIYEPEIALFLNDKIYGDWFDEFFDQITLSLKENGLFLMEGHESHLQTLAELAKTKGWLEVEVVKDYTERDRYLKWEKKTNG